MNPITQSQITDALDQIPYANELGVKPLLLGNELTLLLPYKPEIIGNPILQALHGGAVGAFMETAAIVELWLMGDPKPLPKPISINIDYLRRGKPQDTYARTTIARQGSRVANVRVTAWQENYLDPISILHGNFLTAEDVKS
jgi:acyl-coenzyme A thioesterase PaaI-like protein